MVCDKTVAQSVDSPECGVSTVLDIDWRHRVLKEMSAYDR